MFLLPEEYWEIKNTLKTGRGIFTKKDISAGSLIGDYTGKIMRDKEIKQKDGDFYDMYFNDETSILPNKNDIGIHLLNYSCSPNCGMFPYRGHMLFFALRHIFRGEELTLNYFLPPPEKNHICNDICYCRSPVCHGTMHISIETEELVEQFLAKDEKYRVEPPVPFGEQLPLLKEYPENIQDYPIYDIFGTLDHPAVVNMESEFPSVDTIRQMIRNGGRMIHFYNLNMIVFGIMNGLIICIDKKKLLERF